MQFWCASFKNKNQLQTAPIRAMNEGQQDWDGTELSRPYHPYFPVT